MSYLNWDDKFSVGVPELDRHHKILMDLISQFHDAYAAGKGLDSMQPTFDVLMDYVAYHFEAEETIMRDNGYPQLDDHHGSHEKMIEEVKDLHGRFKQGDEGLALDLLSFLNNWWHFHILEEDGQYAQYFKDQGIQVN
ncbi:MAG: hemerythrin family protein [Rhodospirillales bacterium]|nr:hemerythrin family protein [Rhodospirillales bacterium]